MKMCSLFDGSGGFPLAGVLCGIEPIMASEVEPYPIAVTRSRFPDMYHVGDVSKVNGAEIEPVDLITFGSPCQDLSVAGKRAGLKHEEHGDEETTRSGLFMEAIRVIKEMREATDGKYPTFALWENVPGAFSSNKGEDFRVVLEEFIKIKEPAVTMPPSDKNGWPYADVYVGDGWSLAYRTFDAQFWGVPQRRRRIYLVADFRGERAGKILFEREGLRRYTPQGGEKRQETSSDAEESAGAADQETDRGSMTPETPQNDDHETPPSYTLKIRQGCEGGGKGALIQTNKSGTLSTNNDQYLFQPVSVDTTHVAMPIHDKATRYEGKRGDKQDGAGNGLGVGEEGDPMFTLTSGDHHAVFMEAYQHHGWRESDNAGTLTAAQNDHVRGDTPLIVEPEASVFAMQGFGDYKESEQASGLKARDYKDATDLVCLGIDRAAFNQGENAKVARGPNAVCHAEEPASFYPQMKAESQCFRQDGKANTLVIGTNPGYQNGVVEMKNEEPSDPQYIVRRLTPTECCRLQGFPDGWGEIDPKEDFTDEEYKFWYEVRNTHAAINGKKQQAYTKQQMLTWYNKLHTDSAEYKMWGNGIALPTALYVMEGIAEALKEQEDESHEKDDGERAGESCEEREIP